jgi:hypothetical protein
MGRLGGHEEAQPGLGHLDAGLHHPPAQARGFELGAQAGETEEQPLQPLPLGVDLVDRLPAQGQPVGEISLGRVRVQAGAPVLLAQLAAETPGRTTSNQMVFPPP